jgi:hypothetical protein
MRSLATGLILSMVGATLIGCAGNRQRAARSEPPPAPQDPVIVHLVSRHQTITVTSSPTGPRYSARTSDGTAIVVNATLDELQMNHPEVYRLLQPGVAHDARAERDSLGRDTPSEGPRMLHAGR